MQPFRLARGLGTVILAAAIAGCSSAPPYPGGGSAQDLVIVVDNGHSVISNLTVHLITPAGQRRRLGNVGLNERKAFTFEDRNLAGTYRLLAEPLGGRDFVSHQFTVAPGDQVEWDLRLNSVIYQGRRGSDG